jgi:hypothetical protein
MRLAVFSGLILAVAAHAADQPILGRSLRVASPPGAAPGYRKVVVSARERASVQTISGDPTAPADTGAALLHIILDGATPSAQTFTLRPGTARNGRPFWRALLPGVFEYADPYGEQGPVQSLRLRKDARGGVRLGIKIKGPATKVALAPPNPGSQGHALLTLGTGDRYCVRFGPDASVRNREDRKFQVTDVASEGCPALVEGDFLALSYNVAGLPQGISGSDPEINTPIIAPLLNGYDLVVLQETWKTPDPNPLEPFRVYHEILEDGSLHPFKSPSMPLPFRTDPRRPQAIVSDGLNTFSRFPFDEIVRVMWDGCHNSAADCLALKGFTMARMTIAPGVVVDVYDLHMEAGGDPEDDVLRDQGVTQLSNFIQSNSAGRPVIVGGDFNLHTNAEPDSSQFQRLLAETGVLDVCAALSCPEPGRIDKFLFRSGGNVTLTPLTWHFETDVFVRDGDVPLSDHEALAVRFAWSIVRTEWGGGGR